MNIVALVVYTIAGASLVTLLYWILCYIWSRVQGFRTEWVQPECGVEGCRCPGETWWNPSEGQYVSLCNAHYSQHIGPLNYTSKERHMKCN